MTPEQQAAIREAVRNAIADWQGGCMDARCVHPMSGNCECALAADAAIAAHLKALEAAGLCVAPIKPTKEMLVVGEQQQDTNVIVGRSLAIKVYRVMISARPR